MRPILFFLFLSLIIIACHKEETVTPVVLQDLPLTWVKDSIPVGTLSSHKTAVFVNEQGVERTLQITYTSGMELILLDTLDYHSEWVNITYTDSLDPYLFLQIHGSAVYDAPDEPHEYIYIKNADLETIAQNDKEIYFDKGLFESRNRFFSMLTISGIPFQQVYGNYISPGGNDPREIYYTIARGIVAFSKEDGKVWGLKEIY